MKYRSQAARDAQAQNYGPPSYWDYLDDQAQRMFEHFVREGDIETAETMFIRTLGEALAGNTGD